ncbi:hypothetical protein GCM10023187_55400 [Nibrella viscosa]|uniref:Uncharacterized protein n=1 Tax=Nibrella viscosa TaxID=1084524 RepID=A0ABP8L117_9BACT
MNSTVTDSPVSAYIMEPAMHQQVIDLAYSEDERFNGFWFRRLALVDFYHKLKAEGKEHQEALDLAWSAIRYIDLDEDGKPFLNVDRIPYSVGVKRLKR